METKTCFRCNKEKELVDFYKHPDMPDGRVNKCKECNKKENRDNWSKRREEKRAYDSYRQRHSFQRIFNHRYMNIKLRCDGKISGDRYIHREYCSKQEFIDWCYKKENMTEFVRLWEDWMKADFERRLTPSIDRIDNDKGYTPENMQWLSSVNNTKKHYGKEFI